MIRFIFIFVLLATASLAQDTGEERPWMLPALRACYDAADSTDGKAACEGQVSEQCMQTEKGGESNLGMTSCILAEYQTWDVLLNEEYQATLKDFEGMDADEREYAPEYAIRVESLRAAQRIWVAYRDAECASQAAIWGSGSMRYPVGAGCLRGKTAERTIELWAKRVVY